MSEDSSPQTPYGQNLGGNQYPPPPPPPPPPGAPGGIDGPFDATSAIAWGWRKFTAEAGMWIVAALVVFAASAVLGVAGEVVTPTASSNELGDVLGATFAPIALAVNIASMVLGWVLTAAVYRGALDVTEGRKFDFFGAFSRLDIGQVLLTSLIVSVMTMIGIVLCVLPGLVVAFFSFFAIIFVVDKNLTAIEAIKSSFSLVSSNIGPCLLLALLNFGVILLGIIACCIGLLAAYPVVALAAVYAYRRLQGQRVAA